MVGSTWCRRPPRGVTAAFALWGGHSQHSTAQKRTGSKGMERLVFVPCSLKRGMMETDG